MLKVGKCLSNAGFSSATRETLLVSMSRRIPEAVVVYWESILSWNELDEMRRIECPGRNITDWEVGWRMESPDNLSVCVDPNSSDDDDIPRMAPISKMRQLERFGLPVTEETRGRCLNLLEIST
jgi:hypothetical protein